MLKKHGLLGLAVILAIFAIGVGVSTLQVRAQVPEDCTNGVDDDGDKAVDCDDTDCEGDAKCEPVIDTCTEAAAAGLLEIPPNANKVTLCHFTGSGSNPYVINQPSLSAAETHAGHHDDCVRFFSGVIQCGL